MFVHYEWWNVAVLYRAAKIDDRCQCARSSIDRLFKRLYGAQCVNWFDVCVWCIHRNWRTNLKTNSSHPFTKYYKRCEISQGLKIGTYGHIVPRTNLKPNHSLPLINIKASLKFAGKSSDRYWDLALKSFGSRKSKMTAKAILVASGTLKPIPALLPLACLSLKRTDHAVLEIMPRRGLKIGNSRWFNSLVFCVWTLMRELITGLFCCE